MNAVFKHHMRNLTQHNWEISAVSDSSCGVLDFWILEKNHTKVLAFSSSSLACMVFAWIYV